MPVTHVHNHPVCDGESCHDSCEPFGFDTHISCEYNPQTGLHE